jgi:hypothetical protein
MVTTNRLISLDAVGRDGKDLIHLTGLLQVVARAAMDGSDGIATQVDLRFDAARVRGVGLKSGARYWAEGLHQSRHQPDEFSTPFDVLGRFELLGLAREDAPPTRLTLTVRFRVSVPADGRVRVEASDVELLPDSNDGAPPC